MKRKIIALILMLTMLVSISFTAVSAQVVRGTADAMVSHAIEHVGDKYNQFKDRKAFKCDWCALFVGHCALKSGCTSYVPTESIGAVNKLAYKAVNKKGAKITFVNKTFYKAKKGKFKKSRVIYNSKYKPRKGDLVIFSSGKCNYWWTHVGIVRKDGKYPKKYVYTVEGNKTADGKNQNWKHTRVRLVTRTGKKAKYIVAYITPKYKKAPTPTPSSDAQ